MRAFFMSVEKNNIFVHLFQLKTNYEIFIFTTADSVFVA